MRNKMKFHTDLAGCLFLRLVGMCVTASVQRDVARALPKQLGSSSFLPRGESTIFFWLCRRQVSSCRSISVLCCICAALLCSCWLLLCHHHAYSPPVLASASPPLLRHRVAPCCSWYFPGAVINPFLARFYSILSFGSAALKVLGVGLTHLFVAPLVLWLLWQALVEARGGLVRARSIFVR